MGLDGPSGCSLRRAQSALDAIRTAGMRIVPVEPDPMLIESRCYRYAYDFGIDRDLAAPFSQGYTEPERDALRRTMGQLHEEVVGTGIYRLEWTPPRQLTPEEIADLHADAVATTAVMKRLIKERKAE